jgi:hypothetical protein
VQLGKAKKSKAPAKGKPAPYVESLFNDPGEVIKTPSTKTTAYQRLLRNRKWMSRLLLTILILFPLTLFMWLDALLVPPVAKTVAQSPTENKAYLYVGQVYIEHLLASKATPLPKASFVGIYSVKNLGGNTQDVSYLVASHTEIATLTVEMQNGGVLEGPSLHILGGGVPGQPDGISAPSPWPTLRNVVSSPTVSTAFTQALDGWAQAFTTGTPSQIALAVGDANALDHYQPLSGVSQMQSVTVDYTYQAPKATQDLTEVTMTLKMRGVTQPVQLTYDLLVERALSSAPTIVAWGPPGSGPTLVPYQNAHKG